MHNHYTKVLKNKFEIRDTEEVAFVMVPTNESLALKQIDGIRRRKQKFVCLNDNLNHSDPESEKVVKILHDFYKSMFYHPSQFELPPNVVNKYLYISDLLKSQEEIRSKKKLIVYIGIAIIILLIILCKTGPRIGTYHYTKKKKKSKKGLLDF